ncbi:HBR198Wp [Eremothecium sinecaudum]|uniref:HBR198Wp n=1 Tax=Eremothecium sinecaudum TaxID=45286 RepID=A0A120K173_9SACH|nr:HBR198Wp [Eremothecium sinecaudum]AMD19099.1 HBR198Wp [Eremothecium sinecaudum]
MRRRNAITGGATNALTSVLVKIPTLTAALPVSAFYKRLSDEDPEHMGGRLYTYLPVSVALVLLGGVFAGLTLGLMGQDEMYLKVISSSGTHSEQKYARRVLRLIGRGKHWVLVTLLLSNVITNETLPIMLDRCFGGGWQAVVTSTVLIVVFGEIIPQSICVRYGLQVGAWFSPFVLGLMYLMYPVAYPIALLLDWILGEDHGIVYKKSGLKSLVTLHKTMGVERLTQDEVTIISAVLDLKEKQVDEIMTPIENVFTISADKILDEKAVGELFNSGFSRIPIYLPGQPTNFIGMLLVRVLISYDPEDALPVSHFPLATLPETSPMTSCLNILNYFQEGKSHMCLVSREPGSSAGALGVVTLEDVIEELIGEEIVDESDVFVNIHQRIMREQPGPLSKRHVTAYLHSLYTSSNRASAAEAAVASPPGSQHEGRLYAPDVMVPMNPAANPLHVSNPHITVKRQADILQNSATPNTGRETSQVKSKNSSSLANGYGEYSQDTPNINGSSRNGYGSTFMTPPRMSLLSDHEEYANKAAMVTRETGATATAVTTSQSPNRRYNISYSLPQPSQMQPQRSIDMSSRHSDTITYKEADSDKVHCNIISTTYRYTKNGIVESVITVEGVPKTILEPAVDWDDSNCLHVTETDNSDEGSRSNRGVVKKINSINSSLSSKS